MVFAETLFILLFLIENYGNLPVAGVNYLKYCIFAVDTLICSNSKNASKVW